MDHLDHHRSRITLSSLSYRILELSKKLERGLKQTRSLWAERAPSERATRKLKTAILLTLALVVGICAHRLNQRENRIAWQLAHFPSASVWKASFQAEGYREVINPSLTSRLLRTLPTLTDTRGRAWNSPPDWWVIEGPDTEVPLIFCRNCDLSRLPQSWTPQGEGWEGFEASLERVRQQAKELLTQKKETQNLKKRGEKADPREIRY